MKSALRNQHLSPRRFTRLYIIALSSIAFFAILGQILIQFSLLQQSADARVINLAGRQRMLSQKLSKASLALVEQPTNNGYIEEIRTTLSLWQTTHQGLQQGDPQLGLPGNNSSTVKELFTEIEPNFQAMSDAGNNLLKQTDTGQTQNIRPFVQTLLTQEKSFLTGMDEIVTEYQREAQDHVSSLKVMELALLVLTLAVLVLEGLFIFRPAIARLHTSIAQVVEAEKQVSAHTVELERKNNELELAFQEAMAAHRKVMPHARVVTYGHYQVQTSQGNYYSVRMRDINGNQLLECECLMYHRNMVCSHSLAAAAMHSALLRHQNQQRPSIERRTGTSLE